MKTTKADILRRTTAIIDQYRGKDYEFEKLQGVLCMMHGWTNSEGIDFRKIIDTIMIAGRLDELNKAAREEFRRTHPESPFAKGVT